MECRRFRVTLISASDLLNVRRILKMKVYPKISINGQSDSEWTGPVDNHNKNNPRWNRTVRYRIPEEDVQQEGDNLVIKLYCQRSLKEHKYVGELKLSLKQLFDGGLDRENIEYPISRNGALGQTFGTLKLSYRFESTTCRVEGNFKILIGGAGPSTRRRRRANGTSALNAIAGVLGIGASAFELFGGGEGEEGEEGEEEEEGAEEW